MEIFILFQLPVQNIGVHVIFSVNRSLPIFLQPEHVEDRPGFQNLLSKLAEKLTNNGLKKDSQKSLDEVGISECIIH